jgi:hypothetical protein
VQTVRALAKYTCRGPIGRRPRVLLLGTLFDIKAGVRFDIPLPGGISIPAVWMVKRAWVNLVVFSSHPFAIR